MRHDNIEHRRLRPEPFTVEGDLAFVLRTFGLPEDMDATKAEDLFCGDNVRTCSITGKPCVITTWQCVRADDGPAFYTVEAQPVQVVAKPATPVDPWVKVGTTTIDGDRKQVAAALGLEVAGLDAVLGYTITDKRVLQVGGRNIIPVEWECNDHGGLVHCDIVRRQSEINAEQRTVPCINCEVPTATLSGFCDECMDRFRDDEPPCPECGPHGNRGEVLLASSWAKCTTCAGGKPGDLWGEVKTSSFPGVKSYTLAIGDLVFDEEVEVKRGPQPALSSALTAKGASAEVVQAGVSQFIDALNKPPPSFMDARREALAAQHGQGFKVPTISELYMAEIDNLRLRLMGPPDGMTREEYRRIMFGE